MTVAVAVECRRTSITSCKPTETVKLVACRSFHSIVEQDGDQRKLLLLFLLLLLFTLQPPTFQHFFLYFSRDIDSQLVGKTHPIVLALSIGPSRRLVLAFAIKYFKCSEKDQSTTGKGSQTEKTFTLVEIRI